ncbi:MAG TPA: alpha/beta fold hydrolase [Solirubrobacterales bacterium]|jgi:pimeloyl-ACP methyl ester carboxylesterase
MEPSPSDSLSLRRVEEAFGSLPERYLGGEEGRHATVEIRLADVGRTWQVELRGHRCKVRPSPRGRADVTIGTDAATWLELREGRLSGLDAFRQRRLWARGDLDVAVGFEGLFRLPDDRAPLLRIHDVRVRGARISCLTAGHGPNHAILIHGLGGAKSSFFETVAALSPDHTVHAIDLPGFGASSKPLASYTPDFFARHVLRLMDAIAIDRADLVGNSMGGRVALELGLRAPGRVRTLTLLAPSLAFRRGRELVPLVRVMRPELGALPAAIRPRQVRDGFWRMIARPDRVDPALGDIAADEFLRTHRSARARVAFYAAARQIYLEEPHGPSGFWTRLENLRPPALFVWGEEDRLVPVGFSRHVATVLSNASQVVLPECGHVPQVELPEETHGLVREFIVSGGTRPAAEPAPLARSA